jgi:hypothetical protein
VGAKRAWLCGSIDLPKLLAELTHRAELTAQPPASAVEPDINAVHGLNDLATTIAIRPLPVSRNTVAAPQSGLFEPKISRSNDGIRDRERLQSAYTAMLLNAFTATSGPE